MGNWDLLAALEEVWWLGRDKVSSPRLAGLPNDMRAANLNQ